MKLSVLMVTLTCLSSVKSSDTDLYQRAAAQLERLSAFRRTKEPHEIHRFQRTKDNDELKDNQQEVLMNTDAMGRVDELAEAAYGLYKNPNSDVMVQRIKRAEPILIGLGLGGTVLSAVAAGLSGAAGIIPALSGGSARAVGGLSSGSGGQRQSAAQQVHDSYGVPVQPYAPKEYSLFDFKKAILNTIIQALKAIAGGGLAFGGSLIKGGGFLVQTKGRVISSAGDAISGLGAQIASSAVISSPKPVYGPPGYSYNAHQTQDAYDGPPPSPDASYTDNVYHHGPYGSPSSDTPANEPGLLIAKETKPDSPPTSDNHHQETPPDHQIEPQSVPPADNNYSGPTGSTTVTKLSGVVTGAFAPSQQHHRNPNDAYYQGHKEQPTVEQHEVQEINNSPSPHQEVYQPHQGNDQSHQVNHQEAFQQIQSIINPHLGINQFNYQDNNNYGNNYDIRQSEPLKIPIFDNQNSIDSVNLAVLGLPSLNGSPVYPMGNANYGTWKRSSGTTKRKKGSYWRYRVNDPKIFRI